MKLQLFCVKDVTANRAMQPILRERQELAIRDFENTLMRHDNPMSHQPDDYVLYQIGEWDDETMYTTPQDPVRIITGTQAMQNAIARKAKLDALHEQIDFIKNPEQLAKGNNHDTQ